MVLESLEKNINLEKLNFTSCNLTGNSGYSLSVFLKKRRQLLLESEWAESTGSNENSKSEQVSINAKINFQVKEIQSKRI